MEFPNMFSKQRNEFPFNPFSLTWGSSSFVFQIFFQDLCLFSFYLLILLRLLPFLEKFIWLVSTVKSLYNMYLYKIYLWKLVGFLINEFQMNHFKLPTGGIGRVHGPRGCGGLHGRLRARLGVRQTLWPLEPGHHHVHPPLRISSVQWKLRREVRMESGNDDDEALFVQICWIFDKEDLNW